MLALAWAGRLKSASQTEPLASCTVCPKQPQALFPLPPTSTSRTQLCYLSAHPQAMHCPLPALDNAAAASLQSCPTLCDPIDGSQPGFPSLGFSRQEHWVGCHFLLQCMKVKSESEVAQSCPTLATPWTAAHQAPPSMGFSSKSTGVGCHCLLH